MPVRLAKPRAHAVGPRRAARDSPRRPAVHHDHVTRAGVLAGLMVLTVLTVLAGCTGPGTADVPVADQPARIVAATNEARAAEGLEPLTPSNCATQVATARATALIGAAALEHAPLDDVLTGCDVSVAGENLSRATVPPEDVVVAWMDSAGHRANILDPDFTQLGVACVADGEAALCAQVFLGP